LASLASPGLLRLLTYLLTIFYDIVQIVNVSRCGHLFVCSRQRHIYRSSLCYFESHPFDDTSPCYALTYDRYRIFCSV